MFEIGGEKLRALVDGLQPWEHMLPYMGKKRGYLMPLAMDPYRSSGKDKAV